jgi:hypothetical protein
MDEVPAGDTRCADVLTPPLHDEETGQETDREVLDRACERERILDSDSW